MVASVAPAAYCPKISFTVSTSRVLPGGQHALAFGVEMHADPHVAEGGPGLPVPELGLLIHPHPGAAPLLDGFFLALHLVHGGGEAPDRAVLALGLQREVHVPARPGEPVLVERAGVFVVDEPPPAVRLEDDHEPARGGGAGVGFAAPGEAFEPGGAPARFVG